MIKLENERKLANVLGCEDIDSVVLRDIFSNILDELDELKKDKCGKKDCQCNKHLFIKIDEDEEKIEAKSKVFRGFVLKEFWTGATQGHEQCLKRWVESYYPEVEYSYRFYKCEICKNTYIGITIEQNETETILDIHEKEPTRDEIFRLQVFNESIPNACEINLIDYEIINFIDILRKMSLVHEDPKDYELFPPPPKLSYWDESSYNLVEIEEKKRKLRKQKQLEQRDREQLDEEINFRLKNCQTIEEKIESLNQLKREYIERLEQNENYKRIREINNEFMKWIS